MSKPAHSMELAIYLVWGLILPLDDEADRVDVSVLIRVKPLNKPSFD